ncbi:hypothetical protein [Mesorhizobium sp. 131-2-1]|uniref:hypothetical protein n=1 Tax=Mesorhizobium sp. 131-2-1 TaxID=2744518 RepID=UPI00192674E5|nr:hypothetical protein [Mesorhizobium sp. 131-2-1]
MLNGRTSSSTGTLPHAPKYLGALAICACVLLLSLILTHQTISDLILMNATTESSWHCSYLTEVSSKLQACSTAAQPIWSVRLAPRFPSFPTPASDPESRRPSSLVYDAISTTEVALVPRPHGQLESGAPIAVAEGFQFLGFNVELYLIAKV